MAGDREENEEQERSLGQDGGGSGGEPEKQPGRLSARMQSEEKTQERFQAERCKQVIVTEKKTKQKAHGKL